MRKKPSEAQLLALTNVKLNDAEGLNPRFVDGRTLRGLEQRGWVVAGPDGRLRLTEAGRKAVGA